MHNSSSIVSSFVKMYQNKGNNKINMFNKELICMCNDFAFNFRKLLGMIWVVSELNKMTNIVPQDIIESMLKIGYMPNKRYKLIQRWKSSLKNQGVNDEEYDAFYSSLVTMNNAMNTWIKIVEFDYVPMSLLYFFKLDNQDNFDDIMQDLVDFSTIDNLFINQDLSGIESFAGDLYSKYSPRGSELSETVSKSIEIIRQHEAKEKEELEKNKKKAIENAILKYQDILDDLCSNILDAYESGEDSGDIKSGDISKLKSKVKRTKKKGIYLAVRTVGRNKGIIRYVGSGAGKLIDCIYDSMILDTRDDLSSSFLEKVDSGEVLLKFVQLSK